MQDMKLSVHSSGRLGLADGLIITELQKRQPDLVYFEKTRRISGRTPFTISELRDYLTASAKSKEDAQYKAEAMKLLSSYRGCGDTCSGIIS